MNKQELKQLLKEAVKEVFQEELKNIIMEAIKTNKQPLTESNRYELPDNKPFTKTSKPVAEIKQSYMSILEDMSKGTKSGFEGEFEVPTNIDPMSGTLPDGQLSLSQIMNLTKK